MGRQPFIYFLLLSPPPRATRPLLKRGKRDELITGTFQGILCKVPNQCVKFLPICVIENEKYPINV